MHVHSARDTAGRWDTVKYHMGYRGLPRYAVESRSEHRVGYDRKVEGIYITRHIYTVRPHVFLFLRLSTMVGPYALYLTLHQPIFEIKSNLTRLARYTTITILRNTVLKTVLFVLLWYVFFFPRVLLRQRSH